MIGTLRAALASESLLTFLQLDRPFLIRWLKVAASATAAWLLAKWAFPHANPVYAPITACFVAFVTIRASFQDAAQRVVAVVLGIGVAYFIGSTFGLSVWTVLVVVAIGVLLGQVLRLQNGAANQVPISGLLIMTIGTTPGNVGERIVETLIGAGVSVLVNWLVFPPNHVTAARSAVQQLIDQVAGVLAEMADGISRRWVRAEAAGWLQDARAIGRSAGAAEDAVESGADSLRLRPGRAGLLAEQERTASAMDTIQIVEVQVRVLGRTLRDTADAMGDETGSLPPIRMGSGVLAGAAHAIELFGIAALSSDPAERESARAQAQEVVSRTRQVLVEINADLADMTAANLARGLHLGALVVESGRVLDEITDGLDRTGADSPPAG